MREVIISQICQNLIAQATLGMKNSGKDIMVRRGIGIHSYVDKDNGGIYYIGSIWVLIPGHLPSVFFLNSTSKMGMKQSGKDIVVQRGIMISKIHDKIQTIFNKIKRIQ